MASPRIITQSSLGPHLAGTLPAMPHRDKLLPPVDMAAVTDAALWRLIILLAAFATCLSPILLGMRP